MSSLFGMNAVELTGEDPSPGAGDGSRPVPDEIVSFWPITFKRQILIMCTLKPHALTGNPRKQGDKEKERRGYIADTKRRIQSPSPSVPSWR